MARFLGQQVDSPVGGLGQFGQRRRLLGAGQRPPARMAPGDSRDPRCRRAVPIRSSHTITIEHRFDSLPAPSAARR